jgi:hypothetical protein
LLVDLMEISAAVYLAEKMELLKAYWKEFWWEDWMAVRLETSSVAATAPWTVGKMAF